MPLVRVHVGDTLRDLLGVRGNARAWTLRAAMSRVAQAGNGVVVILRDNESPRDLADAVKALGASASPTPQTKSVGGTGAAAAAAAGAPEPHQEVREVLRTYGVGAQILKDLGVRRMRVLSAPKQIHGISAFDLEIEGYVGEEG